MQKFLVCHTEGKMSSGEVFAVVGKKYPVFSESTQYIDITNEMDILHTFENIPGEFFYGNYFNLATIEMTPIWVYDQNAGEDGDWVLMAEALPGHAVSILIALQRNYNAEFVSGDKPTEKPR